MLETMISFIKNNISNIISILALSLTLIQYFSALRKKREKYTVRIDNAQGGQSGRNNYLLVNMTILNHSSSNLNITRIYFVDGTTEYLCHLKESWCAERYFPNYPETDIPRTKRIFSSKFPLSILPNGATSELIKFKIESKKEITKNEIITLKFVTSKKEKTINLMVMDNKSDLTYH